MGQPLEKYKEVDIYENDIPAKKETKIKVHGFRSRMSTAGEEKYLQQEEQKEERNYQRRPHICGLFFFQKIGD